MAGFANRQPAHPHVPFSVAQRLALVAAHAEQDDAGSTVSAPRNGRASFPLAMIRKKRSPAVAHRNEAFPRTMVRQEATILRQLFLNDTKT